MVQRIYVTCPSCGKLYQLKLQLDQNIKIYKWPISFECVDCGDNLTYEYGQQGLLPKGTRHTPTPQDPLITTIGYSSSLPITDDLYMKDLDYKQSMLLFSPFMNLSSQTQLIPLEEIHKYEIFLKKIQDEVLPYKGVLNALLPILRKGNVDAFSRKISNLFNLKQDRSLSTHKDMYDFYFNLLKSVYINIAPQRYLDNHYVRFIKPLEDIINTLNVNNIQSTRIKLNTSGVISKWYKDEALPYIARSINSIEKILPAMIYASVGISDVTKYGDFKIVTISCDKVMDLYQEGYEVFAHGLKILVGLNNLQKNGDVDMFTNSRLCDIDTITKFASNSAGKMIEFLEEHNSFVEYLDGSMNNKIRNAASHSGGIDYETTTQHIKCHYDATDSNKVYETTLMSVCRHCHILILHLIETTLLARQIDEKATSQTKQQ